MPYNMRNVQDYCKDLSGESDITAVLRDAITITDNTIGSRWKTRKAKLESSYKNLMAEVKLSNGVNPVLMVLFLQALSDAAHYLEYKENKTDITESRQATIDEYVEKLKSIHDKYFYCINVAKPKQALEEDVMYRSTGRAGDLPRVTKGKRAQHKKQRDKAKKGIKECAKTVVDIGRDIVKSKPYDEEVQAFLDSHAFTVLLDYHAFLQNDQRSHSFMGMDFTVANKKTALGGLLEGINSATSMDEIRDEIDNFVQSDDYHVLNKGQNITTRVLGFFGAKDTTTQRRFDAVYNLAFAEEAEFTERSRLVR